jgi:hypothetical protein
VRPSDHTKLDFAVRRLVNESDAEKAAEVAIQNCLEVVLRIPAIVNAHSG